MESWTVWAISICFYGIVLYMVWRLCVAAVNTVSGVLKGTVLVYGPCPRQASRDQGLPHGIVLSVQALTDSLGVPISQTQGDPGRPSSSCGGPCPQQTCPPSPRHLAICRTRA